MTEPRDPAADEPTPEALREADVSLRVMRLAEEAIEKVRLQKARLAGLRSLDEQPAGDSEPPPTANRANGSPGNA